MRSVCRLNHRVGCFGGMRHGLRSGNNQCSIDSDIGQYVPHGHSKPVRTSIAEDVNGIPA